MTNVDEYNKQHKFFCLEIFSIVFGLSLLIMSEAQSAPNCPNGTTLNVDCWSCGDDCTAYLSNDEINANGNKQLNITGSGEMSSYYGYFSSPWASQRGTITNINVEQGITSLGMLAFVKTQTQSITIPDSVTTIGQQSLYGGTKERYPLSNIVIPDSVERIGVSAFEGTSLTSLVIPESVTYIGTRALRNTPLDYVVYEGILSSEAPFGTTEGSFARMDAGTVIYCKYDANCAGRGASSITTYKKDENGVYFLTDKDGNILNDNFWATPDDMGQGVNSACNDYESCKVKALEYKEQKAENMAGGALCATKEGCMELINMANKKDVCSSIADCNNYAKSNNLSSILCENKEQVVWQAHCYDEYPFSRKRWTPAEANEWLKDDDNFVIITFKH